MVFKKTFNTVREAKQHAWTNLGSSIKPDNNFDIQIVSSYQPKGDTPIIPSTPEDWIDTPNSGMLYIIQNAGSASITTTSIWVIHDKNTNKWNTEIALNPKANGYDDAKANLLSTGWAKYDIPFNDAVLTDAALENAVLHQVYAFEKKGERLKTQDISEVLGILLTPTEDGSSDYVIIRNILKKLQKEGLVSPFGEDAWYITDKGKAEFE